MASATIDCAFPGCFVRLRPIGTNDAESLALHANDARVSAHLRDRFPFPYLVDDALAFIAMLETDESQFHCGIEIDGAIVGGVAVGFRTDVERCTGELGYWLGVRYWGRGIMPEVVRAVTDHVHRTHGIIRIFAKVYEGNDRSRRVLEKAGYAYEGCMRAAIMKQDRVLDAHLYAHVVMPTATLPVQ
jgi:[ribosomal protein S5]-alanine N-acetyltransferase